MDSLHITVAHGTWRERKNARGARACARRSEGVDASRDEFLEIWSKTQRAREFKNINIV